MLAPKPSSPDRCSSRRITLRQAPPSARDALQNSDAPLGDPLLSTLQLELEAVRAPRLAPLQRPRISPRGADMPPPPPPPPASLGGPENAAGPDATAALAAAAAAALASVTAAQQHRGGGGSESRLAQRVRSLLPKQELVAAEGEAKRSADDKEKEEEGEENEEGAEAAERASVSKSSHKSFIASARRPSVAAAALARRSSVATAAAIEAAAAAAAADQLATVTKGALGAGAGSLYYEDALRSLDALRQLAGARRRASLAERVRALGEGTSAAASDACSLLAHLSVLSWLGGAVVQNLVAAHAGLFGLQDSFRDSAALRLPIAQLLSELSRDNAECRVLLGASGWVEEATAVLAAQAGPNELAIATAHALFALLFNNGANQARALKLRTSLEAPLRALAAAPVWESGSLNAAAETLLLLDIPIVEKREDEADDGDAGGRESDALREIVGEQDEAKEEAREEKSDYHDEPM